MNKDSNDLILKNVAEVIEYCKQNGSNRAMLSEKYKDFYEAYPALVNLIADDPYNFDFKRLIEMLKIREKVTNNEVKYEDASLYMGQKYYDEYVKPKIEKNTDDKKNVKKENNSES